MTTMDNAPLSTQRFLVTNFDEQVRERDLKAFFQAFGEVGSVMKVNKTSAVVRFLEKQTTKTLCHEKLHLNNGLLKVKPLTESGKCIASPFSSLPEEKTVNKAAPSSSQAKSPSNAISKPAANKNNGSSNAKSTMGQKQVQSSAAFKREVADKLPVIKADDEIFIQHLKQASDVCQQMELTVMNLQMTANDVNFRQRVYRVLENMLQNYFQEFELNVFGSTVSGLGFKNTDIDIVLTLFPDGAGPEQQMDQRKKKILQRMFAKDQQPITVDDLMNVPMLEILNFVWWILLKRKDLFEKPFIIRSKVAPLVKFRLASTSIMCDLSIKNKMAVYNTRFISLCVSMDARFKPLVYTIKWWFKLRHAELATTNKFNSYTLTMLVVFFFQNTVPPIFSTVQQLQNCGPVVEVDGWNCGFCDDLGMIPRSTNTDPLDQLLQQFFEFYANFDFGTFVICPYNGDVMAKETMASLCSNFKIAACCVQDPFEHSRNIAGGIAERNVNYIIREIQQAAALTSSVAFYKPVNAAWGLPTLFYQKRIKHFRTEQQENNYKLMMKTAPSDSSMNSTVTAQSVVLPSSQAKTSHDKAPITVTDFIKFPDTTAYPFLEEFASGDGVLLAYMAAAISKFLTSCLRIKCCQSQPCLNIKKPPTMKEPSTTSVLGKRKSDEDCNRSTKKLIADAEGYPLPLSPENEPSTSISPNGENPFTKYLSASISSENELESTETYDEEVLSKLVIFNCKVNYKFWEGRKKLGKTTLADHPLEKETRISDALFASGSHHLDSPTLFTIKVFQENDKIPGVNIEIKTPKHFYSVFPGVMFPFLQKYLKKYVPRVCIEEKEALGKLLGTVCAGYINAS